MFYFTNRLRVNLIFSKNDDVTNDDIDGITQARVTIQLGDLVSHKHLAR